MKHLFFIVFFVMVLTARADTPPPGTVKSRTYSGDGTQAIGNISDSLKVDVTNSITATVTGPIPVIQSTASSLNATVVGPLGVALAKDSSLLTIISTLGSPFQAGGSIGNSSFGISGTLPAFASTPTFNLGTLNGAATDATVAEVQGSQSGGVAAAKSSLSGGIYNSAAPTLTNGQQASVQLDVNGNLKVTSSGGSSSVTQGTSPWVDNVSQFGGSNVVTGTGVSGAGIPRVTVSSDSSVAATQATASSLNATVVGPTGVALAKDSSLTTINTTLGTPMQNSGGSVTANAGTNLNTSTLALESGGNLAGINAKLGSLGQTNMAGSAPVVIASDQSSIPVASTQVANANGQINNNASVGTSPVTFSVPSNAIGFILEAESSNTANIRWAIGSTASSSVGMLAEPGRDSGFVPTAANISVIAISGTQAVSVQWVQK